MNRSTFTSAIQIAPFNLLDEGIEPALDRLKDLAEIDTLFLYSHTYYGIPYTRTANVLADDHGITQRDDVDRRFNPVWVRHDRSLFRDTSLWFEEADPSAEHAGRDVFAETLQPARQRGMKIYARILEPGRLDVAGRIHNFDEVASVDHDGRLRNEPCRNHPSFRAWCRALAVDLFTHYEIDGYQWGSERSGPLAELLERGSPPGCFCSHCAARAKAKGIDFARAKEGFATLHRAMQRSLAGQAPAHQEGFVYLLSLLFQYPEVLAWERQWHEAQQELFDELYQSIKDINPQAQVGRHVASNGTTLNPFDAAAIRYQDMISKTDFIKPILYHDVMSSRMMDSFVARWRQGMLKGLSEEAAVAFFTMYNGYSEKVVPPLHRIAQEGFSPEYVFEETQRLLAITEGRVNIFPGVGLNVPHRVDGKFLRTPDSPQSVFDAVTRALEAGATGVVASREYDEMRLPSLKAFGDAVLLTSKFAVVFSTSIVVVGF